ncbi:hypothetical protein KUV51_18795 [Tateyamaria omphalii]|uniref:hypothetical protein n=1 Tax=Tateyamaria omphalii TaxID=299262 RepID=UPI001C99ECE8|nr:hypothetical protein [Tateyamaria omphalii]MBY5935060.1 hypothetical protein [Tateyamaria omphalii]
MDDVKLTAYWSIVPLVLKPDALTGRFSRIDGKLAHDFVRLFAYYLNGKNGDVPTPKVPASVRWAAAADDHFWMKAQRAELTEWYGAPPIRSQECQMCLDELANRLGTCTEISISDLVHQTTQCVGFQRFFTGRQLLSMRTYRLLYGHKWDLEFQGRVQDYLVGNEVEVHLYAGMQENGILQRMKTFLRFVCRRQIDDANFANWLHVSDANDENMSLLLEHCLMASNRVPENTRKQKTAVS